MDFLSIDISIRVRMSKVQYYVSEIQMNRIKKTIRIHILVTRTDQKKMAACCHTHRCRRTGRGRRRRSHWTRGTPCADDAAARPAGGSRARAAYGSAASRGIAAEAPCTCRRSPRT